MFFPAIVVKVGNLSFTDAVVFIRWSAKKSPVNAFLIVVILEQQQFSFQVPADQKGT